MRKGRQNTKIYGLDGLRTLALFGVLFYHAFPAAFQGGYFGVIIFFVISGYLAGMTASKIRQKGKIHIFSYYKKRFLRMYPELIIVILCTIGVMTFVCPNKLANSRSEVMSILLAYNNEWQISLHTDYFANLSENSPFTHLWYIAVLIQFEIIWPFLYLAYDHMKKVRGTEFALVAFSCFTIFMYFIMPFEFLFGVDLTAIYYGTLPRIFSLLTGSLLGLLRAEGFSIRSFRQMKRLAACFWIIMYFALSVMLFLWANGKNSWVYLFGLAAYTIVTVLAIEIISDQPDIGRMLDGKLAAFFSRYSYEIYLFQYPVLFLAANSGWNSSWPQYVLQFAVLIVLSIWLNQLFGLLTKSKKKRPQADFNRP